MGKLFKFELRKKKIFIAPLTRRFAFSIVFHRGTHENHIPASIGSTKIFHRSAAATLHPPRRQASVVNNDQSAKVSKL